MSEFLMDEANLNTRDELAVVSRSYVSELQGGEMAFYTSMKPDTAEGKADLVNAMNNPDMRVSDMIGKVIRAKDVFAEEVELVNDETGEVVKATRIVITDTENISYQAVSVGIMSALKKLFMLYGPPTWEDGIPLEVKQIKKGKNNILTFDIKTK